MAMAEKHHKKYNKVTKEEKKKSIEPVWFNENIKREEISDEDLKQLEDLMSKYR